QFKTKFPFAYNYFSTLLELKLKNERKFPQSIILEGADTKSSYYFALELARNLNCEGDKSPECTCTNCKWIKSYTHPAINQVSQIHFKGEGDETKTQISVKQAREIERALALSSDYHRFFILFSSTSADIEDNIFGYDTINHTIEPLTTQQFSAATANALLKSVEEPPENTTFVFLAKSREDILSTIVSRSQVFKLSGKIDSINYQDITPYFAHYFEMDYLGAINLADNLLNYIKENNLNIEPVLNKIIAYLSDILKQNLENTFLVEKINRDISFISESIKHSRASMSDKIILEALFLKIVRGY
ncbi:hypothetical protein IJ531_04735, partial [bacterium]|nr:hypothetical protein [bacterium]